MREFTVIKNGIRISSLFASGNLQALCDFLDIQGFPSFPIHTHEGLLLARVDDDNYLIFERDDMHAKAIALTVINKSKPKPVTHKLSKRVQRYFTLPIMKMETAHYVV